MKSRDRTWVTKRLLFLLTLPLLGGPEAETRAAQPATGDGGGATGEPVRMKAIGVLGGFGPQATMDFEARLHRVAQRRIRPHANGGYPPMVVYYHRRPPFVLSEDGTPRLPIQLDPDLARAASRIGALADFLVITANGPHLAAREIEQAAGRPVLSMVDCTLGEIRRRGWRKVGVLTMGQPLLYTHRLESMGIAYEVIDARQQERLNGVILGYMEGNDGPEERRVAFDAVTILRQRGVAGVILGCTELPLMLGESAEEPDLLNPAQLLAEAAVDRALE